jgi:hypothetical protein
MVAYRTLPVKPQVRECTRIVNDFRRR